MKQNISFSPFCLIAYNFFFCFPNIEPGRLSVIIPCFHYRTYFKNHSRNVSVRVKLKFRIIYNGFYFFFPGKNYVGIKRQRSSSNFKFTRLSLRQNRIIIRGPESRRCVVFFFFYLFILFFIILVLYTLLFLKRKKNSCFILSLQIKSRIHFR